MLGEWALTMSAAHVKKITFASLKKLALKCSTSSLLNNLVVDLNML